MPKKANPQSGSGSQSHPQGVDLSEVEQLLGFMEKHGLEEFEYERDGVRVRLKKPSTHAQFASHGATFHEAPLFAGHALTHPAHSAHAAPAPAASTEENLHVIKSPIVGTFYAAASPGADPFVTVGSKVDSGQVLCIIEAMKLMNEIESDVSGEIARIFAENGQPVEYGEALFGIRPHGKK